MAYSLGLITGRHIWCFQFKFHKQTRKRIDNKCKKRLHKQPGKTAQNHQKNGMDSEEIGANKRNRENKVAL
jgi:hypothetical protein